MLTLVIVNGFIQEFLEFSAETQDFSQIHCMELKWTLSCYLRISEAKLMYMFCTTIKHLLHSSMTHNKSLGISHLCKVNKVVYRLLSSSIQWNKHSKLQIKCCPMIGYAELLLLQCSNL